MKFVNLIIAGLTLAAFAIPTQAQAGANHRVKRTEVRQHKRINQGVRSGQLTRTEAKGLRQDQREINQERKAAKRDDGVIDRKERKELRQDQRDASKNIYEEKHDADIRN